MSLPVTWHTPQHAFILCNDPTSRRVRTCQQSSPPCKSAWNSASPLCAASGRRQQRRPARAVAWETRWPTAGLGLRRKSALAARPLAAPRALALPLVQHRNKRCYLTDSETLDPRCILCRADDISNQQQTNEGRQRNSAHAGHCWSALLRSIIACTEAAELAALYRPGKTPVAIGVPSSPSAQRIDQTSTTTLKPEL